MILDIILTLYLYAKQNLRFSPEENTVYDIFTNQGEKDSDALIGPIYDTR